MIRILIVDDHAAIRAGLSAVLEASPDLVPVAAVEGEPDLWSALQRTKPQVVLLDYHLPAADGLVLCRRIKKLVPAPAVLLYSAYADSALLLPALLAGADGIVSKASPAAELATAIRAAAEGRASLPPVRHEHRHAAAERLEPEDLPIVAMLIDGATPSEIGAAVGLPAQDVNIRLDRMIASLKVGVATP